MRINLPNRQTKRAFIAVFASLPSVISTIWAGAALVQPFAIAVEVVFGKIIGVLDTILFR